ncbi:hypothetical protein [Trinickia diaoshuihuensis]|uniref:hypothetical protein n=1 Tax=Trinickia diaoshuihuensis TaxID=2292265 RepID=UPI003B838A48
MARFQAIGRDARRRRTDDIAAVDREQANAIQIRLFTPASTEFVRHVEDLGDHPGRHKRKALEQQQTDLLATWVRFIPGYARRPDGLANAAIFFNFFHHHGWLLGFLVRAFFLR